MKLREITTTDDTNLYERFMITDELIEEDMKELFAAGKKKLGAAAETLKGAADAPAQKAWAEVQSRLATAGKDDAIGKLKDFASKHKVAIGTLAILGAGMMFSGDASAADAAGQVAGAAGDMAGSVASEEVMDILKGTLDNKFTGMGNKPLAAEEVFNMAQKATGINPAEFVQSMIDNGMDSDKIKHEFLRWAKEGFSGETTNASGAWDGGSIPKGKG